MSDASQLASAPSQHDLIVANIQKLQQMLLDNNPQMPVLLREIHSTLKEDPVVVTLLEEDHIRIIVNGLEKQTNTFLAQSMTKASGAKKAALKNVTSNDLGFD